MKLTVRALDEIDAHSQASEPPLARGRWAILALLVAVTIFNFVDRQTLSVLAPRIRELLHLSHGAYGRIVAAFQFGMMSGEFPMGWLMDRWGVRLGLGAAVLWWSIATGLHGLARSGLDLGLLRFWMGTGECGNFSGGVKTVHEWFPKTERALAIGIFQRRHNDRIRDRASAGGLARATVRLPVRVSSAGDCGNLLGSVVVVCTRLDCEGKRPRILPQQSAGDA